MPNGKRRKFYCNGELYEAYIDEINVLNLNVYRVCKSDSDHTKWEFREKLALSAKCRNLSIENVGTFQESNTGLIKPFVFVHNAETGTYFLLTVQENALENKRKLYAACQLQNSEDESWLKGSIKVLDGPLLLWQSKHCIHIGFTNIKDKTTFEKQSFPVNNDAQSQFSEFSIVSASVAENEIFIFIRQDACKIEETEYQGLLSSPETGLLVWQIIHNEDGQWVRKELDSSSFFPGEYTSAILDCRVTIQQSKNLCNDPKGGIVSTTVLLLEGGYIVELENGRLSRCCQMEINSFTDSREWKLIHIFNRNKCIITTSDNDAVVVDLEKGEVIQTWSDVSSVTVGDFLHHGNHQLVVTFQDDLSSDEITSWLLTDFAGCEVDSRDISDTEADRREDRSKSTASAVEALYNNLQSSSANLCSAEQHLANKVKFLHNTWEQLQLSVKGRETTPYKPEVPLVPLTGSQPAWRSSRSWVRGHSRSDTDLVSKVSWKTTVGSHLIVGVDVHNTTEKFFTHCCLTLVPHAKATESEMMSSFSKWPPSVQSRQTAMDYDLDCSSAKRMRLESDTSSSAGKVREMSLKPKDKVTLTVSTDMSRFSFEDDFKAWLYLSVTDNGFIVKETGDNVMSSKTNNTRTICCGLITIASQEFLQGAFSVSQDLTSAGGQDADVIKASLSSIQTHTHLEVTSTFTDLTQMLTMLQSRTGFRPTPHLDCLCPPSCHPLHLVRLHTPHIISRNRVYLSVWTRDVRQLVLLVRHLYSNLPDDIRIVQHVDNRNVVTAALSHLSEEMKTLSISTRTLLDESSENVKTAVDNSDLLSEVKQPDHVTDFRRRFGDEQTALQRLEEKQTDPTKIKVMRDRVRRAQMNTDERFASLKFDES